MKIKFPILTTMFFLVLVSITFAANNWVNNPSVCPAIDGTNFPGQDCSPDKICGDSSGIAQCYATGTLIAPSSNTTSTTDQDGGSINGGYLVNCYATSDTSSPFCDNLGNYWCDRNSTCQSTKIRQTICLGTDNPNGGFGVSTCGLCLSGYFNCYGNDFCESTSTSDCSECGGGNCRNKYASCNIVLNATGTGTCQCDSGWQQCDGDINDNDGCEVQTGVTCCSAGDNNNLDSSCVCQCDSGYQDCDAGGKGTGNGCEWQNNLVVATNRVQTTTCNIYSCESGYLDCNGDGTGSDGACEIQVGGTCSVAGIAGTYGSSCSGSGGDCQVTPQHYITNTKSNGSSINPIFWGQQYGGGDIFNFTNSTNATIIRIDQTGILYTPFLNSTIDASLISQGTLTDTRLSSNVCLLDRNNQLFTGQTNIFKNLTADWINVSVVKVLTELNTTNLSFVRINTGNIGWGNLSDYPSACTASQTVGTINDVVTCISIAIAGSQITSGSIDDARLSTNVVLKDAQNVFTGINNYFIKINTTEINVSKINFNSTGQLNISSNSTCIIMRGSTSRWEIC